MRLIDADKLANEIRETYEYEFPTASGGFDEFVTKIIPNIIRNMETVDSVPVVHGYWIKHDYAEESEGLLIPNYECSVCHSWLRDYKHYCGDCGAKMDEPVGDSDKLNGGEQDE